MPIIVIIVEEEEEMLMKYNIHRVHFQLEIMDMPIDMN